MVSALFIRKDSIYKTLGVDCWDIERDATNYAGPNSVICHPPCRAWGAFSWNAKPRPGEKQLSILAVAFVRMYGGVIEHPRMSVLWNELKLPRGSERDEFGGFTFSVDQSWFGHEAPKKTLLYIVGVEPKDIPAYTPNFSPPLKRIQTRVLNGMRIKEISKPDRERTPVKFAKWLIELAELCEAKKKVL